MRRAGRKILNRHKHTSDPGVYLIGYLTWGLDSHFLAGKSKKSHQVIGFVGRFGILPRDSKALIADTASKELRQTKNPFGLVNATIFSSLKIVFQLR
jgi:hypothetical protein